MIGKKGVSPIIATVLLLVIAIGLGIVAMNWGRAYLETSSTCAVDTGFDVVRVKEIPQVCYIAGENGYIKFLVENGVNSPIERLQIRAIGANQIYTTELDNSSIAKAGTFQGVVPYNSELFGAIKQLKITPELKVYENQPPLICSEQGLIIENIGRCQ